MKKSIFLTLLGVILAALAACGSNNTQQGEAQNDEAENDTVTIEHELGETEVEKDPEKVVVFDFGALDTLDKLDVDVAGIPQDTVPSYLEKYTSDEYENVASLKEPDFEKIAEIDPDVILISGRQSDLYDQLEELAPTVYVGVATSRYMESFEENGGKIGAIFDVEQVPDSELEAIEENMANMQGHAEEGGENGLVVLGDDDKISGYGPDSRFGLIHDVFGIPAVDEGIEVSTHGMNVSFEYVVEQDPDLLYVVDRSAAIGEGTSEQLVENTLMERTKAYQNDNIFYLDPKYWYLSGGGLVSVAEMIKEID